MVEDPAARFSHARFGEVEVDLASCELRRYGRVQSIQPKAFDLIVTLLDARDRVVSKRELLRRLWPGEVVTDGALTRCVWQARRVIGDDGSRQRIIRTAQGRGYRFVANVEEVRGPAEVRADGRARPPTLTPPLLGRNAETARLEEALRETFAGGGRLVWITGEPGIGKTRLLGEMAARARTMGARVVPGRCYEGDGTPPFRPWVDLLERCLEELEADALRARILGATPLLARLLPELAKSSRAQLDASLTALEERRRLFDGLTRFLREVATDRPAVLALDDLHRADESTLQLLDFVAQRLDRLRVLVVATYRDVALRSSDPLAITLGNLAREPDVVTLHLRGLSPAEVERILSETKGEAASPELAREVHRLTEGNPFFVTEIARLLASGGDLRSEGHGARLPDSVRGAIGQRLAQLSGDCRRMLSMASVIGRRFPLRVLEKAASFDGPRLLDLLGEAEDARFVELRSDAGGYQFSHALVRELLYSELAPSERIRLHHSIGTAPEAGGDLPAARNAVMLLGNCEPPPWSAPQTRQRAVQQGRGVRRT